MATTPLMIRITCIIVSFIFLSSCGHEGKLLKKEDYGDKWPLTVDEGYIKCEEGRIVFESNGVDYAINGHAHRDKKNKDIDPIWAADPKFDPQPNDPSPIRIALTPLLDAGKELCK
jgi:hypothetical protein